MDPRVEELLRLIVEALRQPGKKEGVDVRGA